MVVYALVALLREHKDGYEMDLLDLRNDVVFKSFFGDRRNNKLLLDFLNAILDENIASVELMDPHIELSHAEDKSAIMDLRVITDQDEQINIELQLRSHKAFTERMLLYWSKMYDSQDEVGKSYRELKKTIQIVITDFKLLSKAHFHSMFQLIDREDGSVFSSHAEIHVLELPKLQISQMHDTSRLEKWLLFLQSNKETKEALAMESSTMKEAFEEIQRLSQNPKTRALAISREIHLKDQLQREEDAEIYGIENTKREIVLNMYKKQYPIDAIAEVTNLSAEEVTTIIESNLQ